MNSKLWVMIGAFYSFLGVALGAFGAHALQSVLSEKSKAIYQTAVQYQMFHALGLIGVGLWAAHYPHSPSQIPGIAFTVGVLLFSGSLYALALTEVKVLGAITPIGGVAFLIGWLSFIFMVGKS